MATARLRQLGASEPQVRLFLTFNAAMDHARDADVLARRAALERSHSIAVVVISAFPIESDAARLMVSNRWQPPKGVSQDSPIPFLRDGLPKFSRRLLASTEELFAVRNALAHNATA